MVLVVTVDFPNLEVHIFMILEVNVSTKIKEESMVTWSYWAWANENIEIIFVRSREPLQLLGGWYVNILK